MSATKRHKVLLATARAGIEVVDLASSTAGKNAPTLRSASGTTKPASGAVPANGNAGQVEKSGVPLGLAHCGESKLDLVPLER
eukprot:3061386-Pleurochrysis_carterae.AAC.1